MKTKILNFDGLVNVGLYGFVTDKFLLLGQEVNEKYDEVLKEIFQVDIIRMTIAGTSLIGVFCAGTENKVLVPHIAFDQELEILKEHGIEYEIIESNITCLGNNVIVAGEKVLISPKFSLKVTEQIEAALDKEAIRLQLMDIEASASLMAIRKNNLLTTYNLSDNEVEKLEELGFNVTTGSIAFGSQYIKAGLLVNTNGLLVSEQSGGPEVVNAETALGDNN